MAVMVLSVVERRIGKRRAAPPPPPPPPPPRAPLPALPALAVGGAVLGLVLLLRRLRRPRAAAAEEVSAPPVDKAAQPAAVHELAAPARKSQKVQWADASRPALRLEMTAGSQTGTLFTVQPHLSEVHIGRVASNDFVINDTEVSSQHARLAWDSQAGAWQLVDVGSLNGTRLNGVLVGLPNRAAGAWHPLAHGDVIHFGERDESPAARVLLLPAPPATPDSEARGWAHKQPPAASASTSSPALPIAVGVAEDAARGRPSEDRWLVEAPLRGHPDAALYAVFDGHCGAGAAERAAQLLPAHLARCLAAAGPLPRAPRGQDASLAAADSFDGAAAALREAFLATDVELKCEYEGCAATAVLVWREPPDQCDQDTAAAGDASTSGRPADAPPRRLLVQAANVGDASAALAARYACWVSEGGAAAPGASSLRGGRAAGALRPPLRAVRLTEEHKVKSAPERARLAAAGIVLRDGETRLYGLALSRALGDSFLKVDAASGLTAEPHVSRVACVHAGEGAFAVLASDGLWDALSPAAAVELVARARLGAAAPPATWDEAAAALLQQARARRSKDDCTVLVLGAEL